MKQKERARNGILFYYTLKDHSPWHSSPRKSRPPKSLHIMSSTGHKIFKWLSPCETFLQTTKMDIYISLLPSAQLTYSTLLFLLQLHHSLFVKQAFAWSHCAHLFIGSTLVNSSDKSHLCGRSLYFFTFYFHFIWKEKWIMKYLIKIYSGKTVIYCWEYQTSY